MTERAPNAITSVLIRERQREVRQTPRRKRRWCRD